MHQKLKYVAPICFLTLFLACFAFSQAAQAYSSGSLSLVGDFSRTPDRIWIKGAPDFWANRLQDWRVRDGRCRPQARYDDMVKSISNQERQSFIELLNIGNRDHITSPQYGCASRLARIRPNHWRQVFFLAPNSGWRKIRIVHLRP